MNSEFWDYERYRCFRCNRRFGLYVPKSEIFMHTPKPYTEDFLCARCAETHEIVKINSRYL